jgi:hypothetical protein
MDIRAHRSGFIGYELGRFVRARGNPLLTKRTWNGVNLNVPMSAALKRVIEKPTDNGDPEAYAMRNAAQ